MRALLGDERREAMGGQASGGKGADHLAEAVEAAADLVQAGAEGEAGVLVEP
jgi:hypothetical protein